MANTKDQSDLIWIEEAKIVYEHSRAWFERRIDLVHDQATWSGMVRCDSWEQPK
jgi:hypothetical protein